VYAEVSLDVGVLNYVLSKKL